jgi:hypothetical protein
MQREETMKLCEHCSKRRVLTISIDYRAAVGTLCYPCAKEEYDREDPA